MTLMAIARLCAFWTVWNAVPEAPIDAPAWRIVSTPTTHLGVRLHSDAFGDAAITVQLSCSWCSL